MTDAILFMKKFANSFDIAEYQKCIVPIVSTIKISSEKTHLASLGFFKTDTTLPSKRSPKTWRAFSTFPVFSASGLFPKLHKSYPNHSRISFSFQCSFLVLFSRYFRATKRFTTCMAQDTRLTHRSHVWHTRNVFLISHLWPHTQITKLQTTFSTNDSTYPPQTFHWGTWTANTKPFESHDGLLLSSYYNLLILSGQLNLTQQLAQMMSKPYLQSYYTTHYQILPQYCKTPHF